MLCTLLNDILGPLCSIMHPLFVFEPIHSRILVGFPWNQDKVLNPAPNPQGFPETVFNESLCISVNLGLKTIITYVHLVAYHVLL